ncbi:hypothetical protein [Burkholderia cepacia]|uniref:hypothetical protein n=1 Tax=Burkholderia cepacia TaxID=292 RepID=UPI000AED9D3D|nr:hypothetical protein [Burkholderia cepacia]
MKIAVFFTMFVAFSLIGCGNDARNMFPTNADINVSAEHDPPIYMDEFSEIVRSLFGE